MDADIIIVGGGPAGLSLAKSLSGRQLQIVLIEQQALAQLEAPGFDGREIALTQHSAALMKELGLWDLIAPQAIAPLRDAKVMDGPALFSMVIGHELGSRPELGWLVSNHLIRQAAFQAVQQAIQAHQDITLITGEKVTEVRADADDAGVTLGDGRTLRARLVIAADSRFSTTRRAMGISAQMHDFGKNMLVCCMTHDKPHDFAVAQRVSQRLGGMRLVSTRHSYPLVSVFPDRLVATRFACAGDAAVGMHPVTAHGFNFGLLSVEGLTREISLAQSAGTDIGAPAVLRRYERSQKRATLPLYWMTRLVIEIYTRDSTPAKLVRAALLRLSDRMVPLKKSIALSLSGM